MITRHFRHTYSLALIAFAFLALPTVVLAVAPYTPLVGIPGLTNQSNASLAAYLNRIYLFTVSAGAILGVIKIGIAGAKYSMSDVITDKAEAKKDIWGVLLGLAILLLPYIVLNTIYGGLTNLDVLKTNKIDLNSSSGGGGTPPPTFTPYICQETEAEPCSQFDAEMGRCSPGSGGFTQNCSSECRARGGNVCTPIQVAAGSAPRCNCTK